MRAFLPSALRRPLLGGLGAIYPKLDWAPRPLRAKTTLLSLAASGEEGYARALAVTGPELRSARSIPMNSGGCAGGIAPNSRSLS